MGSGYSREKHKIRAFLYFFSLPFACQVYDVELQQEGSESSSCHWALGQKNPVGWAAWSFSPSCQCFPSEEVQLHMPGGSEEPLWISSLKGWWLVLFEHPPTGFKRSLLCFWSPSLCNVFGLFFLSSVISWKLKLFADLCDLSFLTAVTLLKSKLLEFCCCCCFGLFTSSYSIRCQHETLVAGWKCKSAHKTLVR